MVDVVCVEQPQASWEERSMKHYAGLDVSVKETSICIVDEAGRICREMKVVSHPEDLLAVLCDPAWRLERVGLLGLCRNGCSVDWRKQESRRSASKRDTRRRFSRRRSTKAIATTRAGSRRGCESADSNPCTAGRWEARTE